jgi:ATP-dependent phosphoenolpyruvate carboxykinase
MTKAFNLQDHGITVAEIHRNLPPSVLYEHAIRYEKDASIAQNGALVAYSGVKTGRSPKDKRVVKQGGCYAKAINLTPENEPDIFEALRFGAVLENVVLDEDHLVDYTNISITENTRGAYPIEFVQNAKIPCIAAR